ncbi:hypothetical protein M427DRAFT_51424 [Gonapodya prolifera JEL478]|uniref:Uncharacterized protein n=1 Tax=Gonapodya prolifera (strain JEL478) TaxID=1344416 RepID=A0A139AXH5_GONPJ|nr:hypothetical protein M427DRAFT_51424 [Gonapodya prolifera JEL478]|eukprot:KXS21155.1 hypothetical protein M427DRAFT_51424 [Gonapodya prolifera JEL478]
MFRSWTHSPDSFRRIASVAVRAWHGTTSSPFPPPSRVNVLQVYALPVRLDSSNESEITVHPRLPKPVNSFDRHAVSLAYFVRKWRFSAADWFSEAVVAPLENAATTDALARTILNRGKKLAARPGIVEEYFNKMVRREVDTVEIYIPQGIMAPGRARSMISKTLLQWCADSSRHKALFMKWMLIAPFSVLVGKVLLPGPGQVLFMYCLFRVASHYRAFQGGQHLLRLMRKGGDSIKYIESPEWSKEIKEVSATGQLGWDQLVELEKRTKLHEISRTYVRTRRALLER